MTFSPQQLDHALIRNAPAHTPGPWSISTAARGWTLHGPSGYCIGNVLNANGDPQNAANLRLIQAAPEMLEKLHQYASECARCNGSNSVTIKTHPGGIEVDNDEQPCPDCADIREVIAKAEGRP